MPDTYFFGIRDTLEYPSDKPYDQTYDIGCRTKAWIRVVGYSGRVEYYDWEGHNPDPKDLPNPETQKLEEVAANVIEPVIASCLEHTEQEETLRGSVVRSLN